MTASSSNELTLMLALTSFLALAGFVFFQALMIWRFGGTPGKVLFHLRVVDSNSLGRVGLGSCVLRGLAWMIELVMLGIPFLELLSHRERRSWHDRLAETVVLTTRPSGFEGPHPLEQRFFRNIYWGLFAIALISISAQLRSLYHAVERGDLKRDELTEAGYLCEDLTKTLPPEFASTPWRRMDLGIALYLSDQLKRECLESEADFVVWTQEKKSLAWAHLARSLLDSARPENSAKELARVCELEPASSACEFAKWKSDANINLTPETRASLTYRIAKIRELMRKGDFLGAGKYIDSEMWPAPLFAVVQSKRLQSLWMTVPTSEFRTGFDVTRLGWAAQTRFKMQAWACLAELSQNCGQAISSCETLRRELQQAGNFEWPRFVAFAMAREATCMKRNEPGMTAFYIRTFQQDDPWVNSWLFPTTNVTSDAKWTKIFTAASRVTLDDWQFGQSLWAMAKTATRREHFEKMSSLFQRGNSEDVFWWLAKREFADRAKKLGFDSWQKTEMRVPSTAESMGSDSINSDPANSTGPMESK